MPKFRLKSSTFLELTFILTQRTRLDWTEKRIRILNSYGTLTQRILAELLFPLSFLDFLIRSTPLNSTPLHQGNESAYCTLQLVTSILLLSLFATGVRAYHTNYCAMWFTLCMISSVERGTRSESPVKQFYRQNGMAHLTSHSLTHSLPLLSILL